MKEFLLVSQADKGWDETLLARIRTRQVNKFESHPGQNLMQFAWLDVRSLGAKPAVITVCQNEERLIFLCEEEEPLARVRELAETEKALSGFFSALLREDLDCMEALEERVTDCEDTLLQGTHSDYITQIITFRKELLRLKRYYEQLQQILEGLAENENQLLSEEELRAFRFLGKKVERLLAHIVNLRDYITQMREAYQAQIDIQQNNLMKVFTVVTAIFLPLTLLAGWYGMNLNMPEFHWAYGYPLVIGLSVVVVIAQIAYFKYRKWF